MKRELLIKYLLHEASTSEKKEILEWMQASEENANMLFEMQQIIEQETIETFRQEQENALDNLYQLNRKQQQINRKEKYRKTVVPLLRIAAIFIIGLLTYWSSEYLFNDHPTEKNVYITHQNNSKDQVQEVRLPDGSLVYLNKNTVISYKKDLNYTAREIKLEKGEAYFDVQRDESRPFIVYTDNYLVEVLGTQFTVNTNNDEVSETNLIQDSIRLLTPKKEPLITLGEGQKASYEINSAELRIKEVDAITESAWKEGLFIFNKTPIPEICSYLSKEYGMEISYTGINPSLSFTGEFKRTTDIEPILEMLEYTGKIKYRKEEGKIILFQ